MNQYTYIIESDEELPWAFRLMFQAGLGALLNRLKEKQGIKGQVRINEVTEAQKALSKVQ